MSAFSDDEHELDPKEVDRRLREDGWTVIDVREPYDGDRDRPVIFLCRIGSRSGMATQAFRASGYDAYNMRGGITAWVEAGLPIEPEGGQVADH